MLSQHLLFSRPLLLLSETYSPSDFAKMWLGSRLNQWPNHFRLCFPGTFQHDLCRVPPSWCLHFWCDPTLYSLLPISTSSFRLHLVCSHLSFIRPNIQNPVLFFVLPQLKHRYRSSNYINDAMRSIADDVYSG